MNKSSYGFVGDIVRARARDRQRQTFIDGAIICLWGTIGDQRHTENLPIFDIFAICGGYI